ncbi:MAG: WbqC family protein, partial [Bacteroidota bacterium]
MLLTIHQPEHLPWQGFFHKMAAADCFVVLDNVQYRHHYFQNRNRILAREPMWLTVPVLRGDSHYGRIDQVLIENTQAWRHKYWKSIEQNYRSHPHYERYEGALREIVHTPFDRLIDLNLALIDFFRDALGITCPMVR